MHCRCVALFTQPVVIVMAPKAKAKKPAAPKKAAASDESKKPSKVQVPKAAPVTKAPAASRKRKADTQLDELESVTHPSHGQVH